MPSNQTKMVFMWPAYRKRVVMTGLRTFDNDKINICWEGLNFMNGKEIENKYDITLFRKEIDVNYDEVDTQMWHYYQPHLTIHVGLNKEVQSFVLENMGIKQGYSYYTLDNDEQHPEGYRNACPGPDAVSTALDVDRICTEFNNYKLILRDPTLRAESSDDAGKFLSEHIYYTSLERSTRSPALFVHVPFDMYTSEQLANGLERILQLCLKQLSDDDYYSYDVDIDNKL